MGLYERFLLPHVVHYTCSRRPQLRQRQKLVPGASGEVLEIGFGSGLNLGYYAPDRVERVWALEPAEEMWELGRRAAEEAPFPVEALRASAEEVPLPEGSVDTVVVTYTLCTIPEVGRALDEARRVLRPGGALLYCEHGLAPDASVRRWQRRVNPIWKRLGGGCHLDRDIPALLRAAGFDLDRPESRYIPGWRPASFNYWGRAVPSEPVSRPIS